MQNLLNKHDLAARWMVSTRTVDNYMGTGELPFFKRGNVVRFNEQDVLEFEKKYTLRGSTGRNGAAKARRKTRKKSSETTSAPETPAPPDNEDTPIPPGEK